MNVLFIILFLHQTTTLVAVLLILVRCLSSCSYIKPQRKLGRTDASVVVYHLVPTSNHNQSPPRKLVYFVVYHLVPTSNHNLPLGCKTPQQLFIILFLHQTTTSQKRLFTASALFIILFLHQTTTEFDGLGYQAGCLSSCSYIKPQPSFISVSIRLCCLSSCSYIKPQQVTVPEHIGLGCLSSCSYIKPQHYHGFLWCKTSCLSSCSYIKPQLMPIYSEYRTKLFIILFLHQTTTQDIYKVTDYCCLSSCSYIKPQPMRYLINLFYVVYHLVPTSNHNSSSRLPYDN